MFIELITHLIHSYIRSLGMVNVVLGITMLGQPDAPCGHAVTGAHVANGGAFMGQVIAWGGDAVVSIVVFLLFYRTHEQILRCIERVDGRKKKLHNAKPADKRRRA